jgi:hypothetical protein
LWSGTGNAVGVGEGDGGPRPQAMLPYIWFLLFQPCDWSSYIDLPPRHRGFSPFSFCCHLFRALTDRYCYPPTTSHSPVSQLSVYRQCVSTYPVAKHLKFPLPTNARISLCHRQNIVIFFLCNTWIGAIAPSLSTSVKCDAVHNLLCDQLSWFNRLNS